MSSPILTISIPTYNRIECIQKLVRIILPQLTDEVVLTVIDNQSPYDIYSLFTDKEKTLFRLLRNEVNIGGDANIARCFEYARTKWVWVIGDDDMISRDAVSIVINSIKSNPNIVFIKFNSIFIGKTIGIEGFAKAMKPKFQFGNTFFISEGIHNLEKQASGIQWHYHYLSLCTAQIMRVVKHLSINNNDECLFLPDKIIDDHGRGIRRENFDIVPSHLILFDFFYEYKNLFKDNILKEVVMFSLIAIYESNLSSKYKRYFFKQLISKYGIINIVRYNYRQLARITIGMILGKKFLSKLRTVLHNKNI